MTLQEAWLKLIDMENHDCLSPSQIYSILSDYGIFKENPKLRLVVKSALEYGLWKLIIVNNNHETSLLKTKLINDGYDIKIIESIILSIQKKIYMKMIELLKILMKKNLKKI